MNQPKNTNINKTISAKQTLVGFTASKVLLAPNPLKRGFESFLALTLELSGPRQRVRLNDLLCQPLIFELGVAFALMF